MEAGLIVAVLVVGALALLALGSLRVLRDYERLVVFRLGRYSALRGPGPVWLAPVLDSAVRLDLREQYVELPEQACITRDKAPIAVDLLVYWRIVDPTASVTRVQRLAGAFEGVAVTTLRAVVGDLELDDLLARREWVNGLLRAKLAEATERWGIGVTAVELREIVPPREVQEAMNRQMSAERNRRALIAEADGKRAAAIAVAEGEKQALILRAEGEQRAEVLRAEGHALALERLFGVARGLDAKTMSLQYLDALKTIGSSPATKLVLPLELTALLRPLLEAVPSVDGNGKRAEEPRATERVGPSV